MSYDAPPQKINGQSSIPLNFFVMNVPLRLNEIIYQFSNHE